MAIIKMPFKITVPMGKDGTEGEVVLIVEGIGPETELAIIGQFKEAGGFYQQFAEMGYTIKTSGIVAESISETEAHRQINAAEGVDKARRL